MFCKEIIIKEIPVLKPGDSGFRAAVLMEDLKLKHLPIVNGGNYICLLSEKDIFSMGNQEDPIGNSGFFAPCIGEESSLLEVLQIMSKNSLTLLPVVRENGEYLGSVTLPVLMEGLNELCNTSSKGALIAIETTQQEYVLSQIIRLIESNNAMVLSFFTGFLPETDRQILLFKIDLENASPVLRSLERFDFRVIYSSQRQQLPDETLKKRLDELMFYLEM
jgi:CBS domain-containing protein